MRKNITKRRRYKNRRSILRGGNIDDDADQLIESLRGYDHNSIVKFLENIKDNSEFINALKEKSSQFETLRSTCNYTQSFDKFVDEMIRTAVSALRNESTTSEESKQNLTSDAISGLLPENTNLDALLKKLMEKYAAARDNCLSVEGSKAKLSQKPDNNPNTMRQKYQLRRGPLLRPQGNGGSRRKNKKSKRMRRKQRGGLEPVLIALIATGAVIVIIVGIFSIIKVALGR
jgi:hypothetical protein